MLFQSHTIPAVLSGIVHVYTLMIPCSWRAVGAPAIKFRPLHVNAVPHPSPVGSSPQIGFGEPTDPLSDLKTSDPTKLMVGTDDFVGAKEGPRVGLHLRVGFHVSPSFEGRGVGLAVGRVVGALVGRLVGGLGVGRRVGAAVGERVGFSVGRGEKVGLELGRSVGVGGTHLTPPMPRTATVPPQSESSSQPCTIV